MSLSYKATNLDIQINSLAVGSIGFPKLDYKLSVSPLLDVD